MTSLRQRIFRATLEAWVCQLVLPGLFFFLLIYTILQIFHVPVFFAVLGWSITTLLFTLDVLLPMVTNWVSVDANGLQGSLNGRAIRLCWQDVIAACQVESRRGRLLCLGTRAGTLVVPLRFLDKCTVWNVVTASISPRALEKNAWDCVPDWGEWKRGAEESLDECGAPSEVIDHWAVQVFGWGGFTLCIGWAVAALRGGAPGEAAAAVGGMLLSLFLLLHWGVTEIGSEQVERNMLFSGWKIAWEEVERIEVDLFAMVIVFCGKDRRLAIPGPVFWSRDQRRQMMLRLEREAEHRSIPLRRSLWALFKSSHHTRTVK